MVVIARKGVLTVSRNYDIPDTLLRQTVLEDYCLSRGIGYWTSKFYDEPENRRLVVLYREDPDDTDAPLQTEHVSYDAILEALGRLAFGEERLAASYVSGAVREFFAELDDPMEAYPGGSIDADVSDAAIQIAAFGEPLYG